MKGCDDGLDQGSRLESGMTGGFLRLWTFKVITPHFLPVVNILPGVWDSHRVNENFLCVDAKIIGANYP